MLGSPQQLFRDASPASPATMPKADKGAAADGGKGKKIRKLKDHNAPKKPVSAFMLWSQDARAEIKRQNPELDFGGIGRKMGEIWKDLDDETKNVRGPARAPSLTGSLPSCSPCRRRGSPVELPLPAHSGTKSSPTLRRSGTTATWRRTRTARSTTSLSRRRPARATAASCRASRSGQRRPS